MNFRLSSSVSATLRWSALAAACLLARSLTQAQEPVYLDGLPVHPTRLLARLKPEPDLGEAAVAAGASPAAGVEEEILAASLVPGLVYLDEVDAAAARATAAASAAAPVPAAGARSASAPATPESRLRERLRALRDSGRYLYVEPDYIVTTAAVPDDAAFAAGDLWGLRNTGQAGGTAGVDIDAERAWDLSTGSSQVVVALIDGGIRYTHRDLADRLWRNPGESGAGRENNGLDDDGDGYVDNVFGINAITGSGDPWDDRGHGTHVAGTIGAAANNGSPHVGVAWDVRLMALKFTRGETGAGATSDAIECINFAVSKGARILNNSWGGPGSSQALRDALAAARDAGVLVVAAAGNEGRSATLTPSYPAAFDLDNIISVAAMDRNGQLAEFSNYGIPSVDIAAPGVAIFSTGTDYTKPSLDDRDAVYRTISGTSMATPHVSGVAALMLAREPGLSVAELRRRILASAIPTPGLAGRVVTAGRLTAYGALVGGPDGVPEIRPQAPEAESEIEVNSSVTVRVLVTDFDALTGATVWARIGDGAEVQLRDNGSGGDIQAGDAIYSGVLLAPSTAGEALLDVRATSPGGAEVATAYPLPIVRRPSNDKWQNAETLGAVPLTVTANYRYATSDPGQPIPDGGRTLWWRWTAPDSDNYYFSARTGGTTTLTIYDGTPAAWPTPSAQKVSGLSTGPAELRVRSTAGKVFYISVGTNFAQTDEEDVILAVTSLPGAGGDTFGVATPITFTPYSITSGNVTATAETNEPAHGGLPAAGTRWWDWTSPTTARARLSTAGSAVPTVVAAYTGDTLENLVPVAAASGQAGAVGAVVEFDAQAGVTYRIVVGAAGETRGNISLALSVSQIAPPVITSNPVDVLTTVDATVEFVAAAIGATDWQWQRSTDEGATWANLNLALTNKPTLSVLVLSDSYNNYLYRVRAYNAGGGVFSAPARLTLATGFNGYLLKSFSVDELADATLTGATADPDGDGLPNLLEYAFGTKPREADAAALSPRPLLLPDGTFAFRHVRRLGSADLAYRVEYSDDLAAGEWLTGADHLEEIKVERVLDRWEIVTTRPRFEGERAFLRVRVTSP